VVDYWQKDEPAGQVHPTANEGNLDAHSITGNQHRSKLIAASDVQTKTCI